MSSTQGISAALTPSGATVIAASQPQAPRTLYARPLNQVYGNAYQFAQHEKEKRAANLLLRQQALEQANNTVHVVFWPNVRLSKLISAPSSMT